MLTLLSLGFTGTQQGMTHEQAQSLGRELFRVCQGRLPSCTIEWHHGDCIGADAQSHLLARFLELMIILHPPYEDRKRAFCKNFAVCCPPKSYLERNWDIVRAVELMFVCPKEPREVARSGTWATYRYALQHHRKIVLILPDGFVRKLNHGVSVGRK